MNTPHTQQSIDEIEFQGARLILERVEGGRATILLDGHEVFVTPRTFGRAIRRQMSASSCTSAKLGCFIDESFRVPCFIQRQRFSVDVRSRGHRTLLEDVRDDLASIVRNGLSEAWYAGFFSRLMAWF